MKSLSVFGASALLIGSLAAQTTDTPQALAQAIQRGDRAAISSLLDNGIKLTGVDAAGVPSLMLATLFGDASLVEQLLKHGADPNQTDKDGATALMWAIPDIQKVRRLIERGANVNARSSNLGRTPLLVAAGYPGTVDVVTLLLAQGADLRAKDAAGLTALDIAMLSDADVEVVRLLVEKGLDPNEASPAAVRAVYARPRPALVQYMIVTQSQGSSRNASRDCELANAGPDCAVDRVGCRCQRSLWRLQVDALDKSGFFGTHRAANTAAPTGTRRRSQRRE